MGRAAFPSGRFSPFTMIRSFRHARLSVENGSFSRRCEKSDKFSLRIPLGFPEKFLNYGGSFAFVPNQMR
jgi:hypothetical protein